MFVAHAEQIHSRSALKVAQVDLAAARSHMQQFQEISQANEAALSALNATHDQYKTETEAQISKNEVGYPPIARAIVLTPLFTAGVQSPAR
jgi:hypothetical protein